MIYTIGDSFTFGDELPGSIILKNFIKPSELAWPSLLEKKWNKPVTNLGRPASGNTRLIKRAMDCVFKGDAEFIIVAWTSPYRIEWCDSDGIYDIWAGRNIKFLDDHRKVLVEIMERDNCDNVDRWQYNQWLRDVILLQSFFKIHNQRYLMLQSHLSQKLNNRWWGEYTNLTDQVDSTYFLGWPSEGMTEWIGNTTRGPGGHPLEDGHQQIAKKIDEYIRNLGWLS